MTKYNNRKKRYKILLLFLAILSINLASALDDAFVWKGQYYIWDKFQQGNYNFNFTVYDNLTNGTACYSNITQLTTGFWGQWETEQFNISKQCNDSTQDYFLEVKIDDSVQYPRKRLIIWTCMKKNVPETISEDLTSMGTIKNKKSIEIWDNGEVKICINKTKVFINTSLDVDSNNLTAGIGLFSYLGSLTNKVIRLFVRDIDVSGNINQTNGNASINNYYGEFWINNEAGFTIVIGTLNTWYNLTNFTQGYINGFNLTNGSIIDSISMPGKYFISYSVSFIGTSGNEYQTSIFVNNAVQNNTKSNYDTSSAFSQISGQGVISLNQTDWIQLKIRDISSNKNVKIETAQIYLNRIGE